MLVYLYSSYQLMMIGSIAFVIGNCLSTVLTLNDSYQPEYVPKLKGKTFFITFIDWSKTSFIY